NDNENVLEEKTNMKEEYLEPMTEEYIKKVLIGAEEVKEESCIVASNLRRAISTAMISLWYRLEKKKTEPIKVLSSLQELGFNADTRSSVSKDKKVSASRHETESGLLDDLHINIKECYEKRLDMTYCEVDPSSTNNKTPQQRMHDFVSFLFANTTPHVVIAVGHSFWFQTFFKTFLPSHVKEHSLPLPLREHKIKNSRVVAFRICKLFPLCTDVAAYTLPNNCNDRFVIALQTISSLGRDIMEVANAHHKETNAPASKSSSLIFGTTRRKPSSPVGLKQSETILASTPVDSSPSETNLPANGFATQDVSDIDIETDTEHNSRLPHSHPLHFSRSNSNFRTLSLHQRADPNLVGRYKSASEIVVRPPVPAYNPPPVPLQTPVRQISNQDSEQSESDQDAAVPTPVSAPAPVPIPVPIPVPVSAPAPVPVSVLNPKPPQSNIKKRLVQFFGPSRDVPPLPTAMQIVPQEAVNTAKTEPAQETAGIAKTEPVQEIINTANTEPAQETATEQPPPNNENKPE
ncbi:hypothetical protein RFI_25881, partial [Reticulomyxa filosa]